MRRILGHSAASRPHLLSSELPTCFTQTSTKNRKCCCCAGDFRLSLRVCRALRRCCCCSTAGATTRQAPCSSRTRLPCGVATPATVRYCPMAFPVYRRARKIPFPPSPRPSKRLTTVSARPLQQRYTGRCRSASEEHDAVVRSARTIMPRTL